MSSFRWHRELVTPSSYDGKFNDGTCQAQHFSETGSIDEAGDFCEYEKKGIIIINGIISSCKMIDL